jgi:site-specific DNA-adenine methylase
MDVDDILNRYNITKDYARRYIDAIVHLNQSQAAEEAGISRETARKYKNAIHEMTDTERAALISSLAHETLLERIQTGEQPE